MDTAALRSMIYRHTVETGLVPSRIELESMVDDPTSLGVDLARLHDAHAIVLDDRPERAGEIRMALPFAAEPTDYRVTTASGGWWANCAWDSLAVAAALHQDARVESRWADTGESLVFDITDGRIGAQDGFVHFRVAAAHWWDDIVRT